MTAYVHDAARTPSGTVTVGLAVRPAGLATWVPTAVRECSGLDLLGS